MKILPDAFAADPDRLARFTREAQIFASLNHPNIAQIHGIEEAEGTRALVLELVQGPTLADRISKGPIPLDEALPIAKQIAEALEAAHEAGGGTVTPAAQLILVQNWFEELKRLVPLP
ncbi:MAG: protein kinase [Planctomycetota bacterium]|nr:protein kinase [Planctomycetota bacterium]